ncbi:MAG: TolC family outer membrane protein, partial [Gammaproteobacteria bacterium]|nr:TolC family outer membrane protein [Gammaproteobacteria bacterium]
MKRASRSLVLAVALALVPLARADDLIDAYRPAEKSDPQLAAALNALRAVREADDQARAPLLPQVSANANIDRSRFDNTDGPTNYSTNEVYGVALTQTVYNRELFVGLGQAGSRIAQAEADYEAARQDLALRVAQRYFEVLSARAGLEFVRADKKATQRQLEQARQRFEVGLIAITDVREAQARYDQTVAQEIVAENQLDSAREALTEVTGVEHGALADLQEQVPLQRPDPDDMSEWVSTAEEQNLQVVARRAAAEVARQQVERQRSGHYPTVNLRASHELQDINFGGIQAIDRQESVIGLQAELPLFEGFGTVSATREAMHLFHQAQDQLEQAHRSTVRSARDAYRNVTARISQVRALAQALES